MRTGYPPRPWAVVCGASEGTGQAIARRIAREPGMTPVTAADWRARVLGLNQASKAVFG